MKKVVYLTPEGVNIVGAEWRDRLVLAREKETVFTETIPAIIAPLSALNRKIDPNEPGIPWVETEEQFLVRVMALTIRGAKQSVLSVGDGEDPARIGQPINPHLTEDTPFKIIDAADVPADRSKRGALISEGDPDAKSLNQRLQAKAA